MSDEPGKFDIGAEATVQGVVLYIRESATGKSVRVGVIQPENVRNIARNLTLRSFEVEDMRKALGLPE